MDEVWDVVWWLGGGVAARGVGLLHSYLMCQPLLDGDNLPAARPRVPDAAPALVTLLAAKTRRVLLVSVQPQLSRCGPAAAAATRGCACFPLRELVLTGVDMGSELNFLLHLLPCCKSLLVLKLGGNCTPAVLEAARDCPLSVLHLSERMAWQPRMTEDALGKLVIGAQGTVKNVLDAVRRGEQVSFTPAWPDLSDVSTGWCKAQDFLLLLLVAFPRLQHLGSQLVDTSVIVRRYTDLALQVLSLPKLSLRVYSVISGNFSKVYRCYPNTSELHLLNVTDVERVLWEIVEASVHLPQLHVLRLSIIPGPLPQPPSLALREEFVCFGKRITELHLEKGHGSWAFTLLSLFPSVQCLRITGDILQIPEERGIKMTFPSVSRLECMCDNSTRVLLFLASSFPNLVSLTLKSQRGGLSLPWEQLGELVNLRDWTLLGTIVENVANLCLIPRETSDTRYWKLSVLPGSVTPGDLQRLRWCGWTCLYVSDFP